MNRRITLPAQFLNRELGILAFNRRVLAQAADESVPLLERLRFITIVSSNLDEFFEIRVAGLKEQIKLGLPEPGPDGRAPTEVFEAVSREAHALVAEQYQLLNQTVLPALAARGHRVPEARGMERGAAPVDPRLLLPRAAAGADADRARPRAPVPARVQQEPELRGRARRPRRVRPQLGRRDRAGAARAAARHPPAAGDRRRGRVRVRVPVVDPARAHGRAVLRHERARAATSSA